MLLPYDRTGRRRQVLGQSGFAGLRVVGNRAMPTFGRRPKVTVHQDHGGTGSKGRNVGAAPRAARSPLCKGRNGRGAPGALPPLVRGVRGGLSRGGRYAAAEPPVADLVQGVGDSELCGLIKGTPANRCTTGRSSGAGDLFAAVAADRAFLAAVAERFCLCDEESPHASAPIRTGAPLPAREGRASKRRSEADRTCVAA